MQSTFTMVLPCSLLAAAVLFTLPQLSHAQTDNGNECSCFRTNASSQGYFTYHRFHDYRNVATPATTAPTLLSTQSNATNAIATADFFTTNSWRNDWAIQNWNNSDSMSASGATISMVNSPSNVYLEKSNDSAHDYSSYLVLRTARLPTFQSAAEIDSTEKNYHYMSARFMARVVGSPGACAGLFTYLSPGDASQVQEADIEILTSGPRNVVQYTNQPSNDKNGNDLPEATVNSTTARDWSVWNSYRMDWMPKMTSWYVNGVSVANISFQTPRDPAGLILNMWGDGGVWTGNMSTYDQAYLHIQYIQLVYNTSGPYNGDKRRDVHGASGLLEKRKGHGTPGCKVVCGIDEKVNVTGTPAVLMNNTGGAALGWKGEGMGLMAWLPVLAASAAMLGSL